MNVKTVLFLSLATIYSLTGNTQTVKWGMAQKSTTDSKPYYIIGADDKGLYEAKIYEPSNIKPKVYTLEKYDFPDMKREYSNEIHITENGTPKGDLMACNGVYCMKDNLLGIFYGYDVQTIYAIKLNADGTQNNKVQLDKVYNKWHRGILPEYGYAFYMAKDRKSLIGRYLNPKENNKVTFRVVDESGNQLWVKEYNDIIPGKKGWKLNGVQSADGNVIYMLVFLPDEGYKVFKYDHSNDKTEIFDVPVLEGDKLRNQFAFSLDKSGSLVFAGFYGDEKSKDGILGTFNIRLNSSGKTMVNKATPFDKDMLAHVIDDGKISSGKGIDQVSGSRFNMDLMGDGSVIVSTEQSNGYLSTQVDEYDYYDVIVAKINADGTTGWVRPVAKKQATRGAAGICSYSLFVGNKNVYVLFNDHEKNANVKSQAVLDGDNSELSLKLIDVVGENPTPMIESIDILSGKATRGPLVDGKGSNNLRYFTNMYYQQDPNSVYLYKYDSKNDEFGQLTIE